MILAHLLPCHIEAAIFTTLMFGTYGVLEMARHAIGFLRGGR